MIIDGSRAALLEQYPGYAVTEDGRVWSFWRKEGPSHRNRAVIDWEREPKQLSASGKKYLKVQVQDAIGVRSTKHVHRLVLLGFVGPKPDGMESRHLDGDIRNNSLLNLEYGTWLDNHADKEKHGNVPRGSVHVNSKLTEEQVVVARRLWRSGGITLGDLVSLFPHVHKATIHDAVTGKTWQHLPDPDERPGIDTTHGCDGCCNVFCDGCGWYVDPRSRHVCFSGA